MHASVLISSRTRSLVAEAGVDDRNLPYYGGRGMTRITALRLAQFRSGWIHGQQVWMWGLVAALCVVGLSACRSHGLDRNGDGVITVICLGDSNTAPRVPPGPKWCEFVAQLHPDWKVVNDGALYAKAAGDCFLCGKMLLGSALLAGPDIVILALGTNDRQQKPEATVDALLSLRDQAARTKAEVFIATIPPIFERDPSFEHYVNATNALLAQRVAPSRLVDFFSDMQREDFLSDGVHIKPSGQHKRAAAAEKALKNL
jgi:lysophospholipase L1-like esterase